MLRLWLTLNIFHNLSTQKVFYMASVHSTSTVSLELLKDCDLKLPMNQWLPRRRSRRGRTGYSSKSLFFAYLLKLRENISHDTKLAQKLRETEIYRDFYGFIRGKIPSHDTLFIYKLKKSIITSFDWLRPSYWRKKSLGSEKVQLRQKCYYLRSTVECYQSFIKELLNELNVLVHGLLKVKKHLYEMKIMT